MLFKKPTLFIEIIITSSKTPFTPGLACVSLSVPYLMCLIARFEVLNSSGFEDVLQCIIV